MAYDGVYLLKAAIEKAKTIETNAVIKAMEGMSLDSLRGKFSIRALDHMGTVPCYQGVIAKDPNYPFKIWKDVTRVPGDQVIRPRPVCESLEENRCDTLRLKKDTGCWF